MSSGTKKKTVYMTMDLQEERHDQPWTSYHIETSKRLDAILNRLKESGLYENAAIEHLPRRKATKEELELVHTPRYVQAIENSSRYTTHSQMEEFCTYYEDIFVCEHTWNRACLAAATAIDLVGRVADSGSDGIAFVRPPGHHASPDAGCGFCIFNNVALAASHVAARGKRVMIVDYDVHAANGTQECVERIGGGTVKLASIHRYEHGRFWPNISQSGIYHDDKNTMNLPLNAIDLTDADYLALFTQCILPAIHAHRPDVIIVSSGFDASLGDPEGCMKVTPAGFATMVRKLQETGVPVAAILEGGYFLDALAADSEWVVRTLLGETIPRVEVQKIDVSVVDTIARIHAKYEKTSSFYAKILELRRLLELPVFVESGEMSDYEGERLAKYPYDTRGIYVPFSAGIELAFKTELENILESYKNATTAPQIPFEIVDDVADDFLGVRDGKLVIGGGKAAKLFAQLVFLAPIDPLFVTETIGTDPVDFNAVTLDKTLKELKNIPIFKILPLLQ
ncbi:unnamed protein product [Caenorhabditis sp. 36 PRJEB53466]|nr:unnamed protein product [Caenorhabditis sp. 36 PRJEB53466]